MITTDTPLAELNADQSKYVIEATGQEVPRVTDITGLLHKPALVPWAEKVGRSQTLRLYEHLGSDMPTDDVLVKEELAERGWNCESLKEAGGTRGSSLHLALETYVKTGSMPRVSDFPEEEVPYVKALTQFFIDYEPQFHSSEVVTAHPDEGYAGTFDGTCTIGKQPPRRNKPIDLTGALCLCDLKTNKAGKVYKPEHYMQVAAYEGARTDGQGEAPTDHQIVIALGEGTTKGGKPVYQVGINPYEPETFYHLARCWHSMNG